MVGQRILPWLERSLRLLAKHHNTPAVVVFFDDPDAEPPNRDCRLYTYQFEEPISTGATLADAVEHGIRQLTDEQILAAEALLTPLVVEA